MLAYAMFLSNSLKYLLKLKKYSIYNHVISDKHCIMFKLIIKSVYCTKTLSSQIIVDTPSNVRVHPSSMLSYP